MAGTDDWSTDPDANTTISYNGTPLNIAELCDAANLNNMGRAIMALSKGKFDNQDALIAALQNAPAPSLGPILTAIAALTPAANQGLLFTGPSSVANFALTAFARTILDDADAATARSTLGAVGVVARQLGNPGYVKFSLPGAGNFMVAWGSVSAAPNASTQVVYPSAFPNASFPVCSGGVGGSSGQQDNTSAVVGASASGFTIYNAWDGALATWWIAVGY